MIMLIAIVLFLMPSFSGGLLLILLGCWWLLQRGITPCALSRNEKRIRENLNVFDFALTEDEMRAIAKLDRGQFVLTDDEKLA